MHPLIFLKEKNGRETEKIKIFIAIINGKLFTANRNFWVVADMVNTRIQTMQIEDEKNISVNIFSCEI